MQRFFLIIPLLICLIYSHNAENKVWDNPKPAVTFDLKQFEESAEEFTEQFSSEAVEIDLILSYDDEFLEHSFSVPHSKEQSLTQNHTTYSTPLMPYYTNQKAFHQMAEGVIPSMDEYSLLLPLIFYHPPQS